MSLAVPKERQELSLKVKQQLAKCAAKLRAQWETEKSLLLKKWDSRRRIHVHPEPKWGGYLKRCVDENFLALQGSGLFYSFNFK